MAMWMKDIPQSLCGGAIIMRRCNHCAEVEYGKGEFYLLPSNGVPRKSDFSKVPLANIFVHFIMTNCINHSFRFWTCWWLSWWRHSCWFRSFEWGCRSIWHFTFTLLFSFFFFLFLFWRKREGRLLWLFLCLESWILYIVMCRGSSLDYRNPSMKTDLSLSFLKLISLSF